MPASLRPLIVSSTSSCSLFSIAVDPISFSPCSIYSSTSCISFSLLCEAAEACKKRVCHSSKTPRSISFLPRNSVLRPYSAYMSTNCCTVAKFYLFYSLFMSKYPLTMESAPLHSMLITLVLQSRTTTDIRLRSPLNASVHSSSYCSTTPSRFL